nr:MAG TPA: hypothetical protein [Caudoviricetes sp.]
MFNYLNYSMLYGGFNVCMCSEFCTLLKVNSVLVETNFARVLS